MGFEGRAAPRPEVICTPGIVGGKPCVAGTRIPADMIILYLNEGASRFTIFEDFPSLPVGGIEAVIKWAQEQGINVELPD